MNMLKLYPEARVISISNYFKIIPKRNYDKFFIVTLMAHGKSDPDLP